MKLILTHEQADMDALASLLGGWLLQPDALPLLPRNINRNGRSFVRKYREDLPFIERSDLPREPIEAILLVDTQALITLKGMNAETRVIVYDHHPLREDLNPDWELHMTTDGANTSQMVARIKDADLTLTPIQATTLALGLHEDTGSFTYGSTTPDDLEAAAFCLSQGADMDMVTQYLYPPLSKGQRRLYDRLLRNIQTLTVEGQTILAAKADATDVDDEISSVAHKLRDVLNPDALLLLVATTQGIRLVARATNDRVDVSTIAEAMGGGGHRRAASALIRPDEHLDEAETLQFLDARYEDMIAGLGQHVQPETTVGAIMSKDPLILSPDTSAKEAHRLMQRYGYEGYPVVALGDVVGLLNRREVDRAMAHGLDLTVESLMAAGDVQIAPDAPLEELQSLMGTSGWGQVPVVDADGEIIGIVTRTDLLKTLTPKPDMPTREDVTELLAESVPPARLALLRALAEEAGRVNLPIFVVGGFVRDLLLERPSLDFDIVVEGDAIFFANRLSDRFGGRVVTHKRFGTAKWETDAIRERLLAAIGEDDAGDPAQLPDSLDLISARTEFYEQPAALPTVESASIKMDLHRRDFTINTLALRLDGEHFGQIYDYWGGLADLRKGHIRVLHALSFVDDATRLLRAVRFEQRFGFEIEPRTLALMEESLPLLDKLTGARLRHEINLILAEPKAPRMMERLAGLGILTAIHPALPWRESIRDTLAQIDLTTIDPAWGLPAQFDRLDLKQTLGTLVWLGRLSKEKINAISKRLRLKADLKKLLLATSKLNKSLPNLADTKPSQVVQRCTSAPAFAVYAAYLMQPDDAVRTLLWRYASEWAHVSPETNGDDLRALGLKPSPAYGEILTVLRDAWLDGEISSAAEERALLEKLVAEAKAK
ncbi:CBS domain-containing protein [bacterium]|nr:CBS domain-containing protein [bacterium]